MPSIPPVRKPGYPLSGSGKSAVRFNALTWSLRARSLIISGY